MRLLFEYRRTQVRTFLELQAPERDDKDSWSSLVKIAIE